MAERDFDQERNGEGKAEGHKFKLGGIWFVTKPGLPPNQLLRFKGVEEGNAFEEIIEFLRSMILPEYREQFEKVLDGETDVFVPSSEIADVSNWLLGVIAGRPTSAPESSSTGREDTSTTSEETASEEATTGTA